MSIDYKFLEDIIIPILSAFIGGGLTLVGVIITIVYERKKSAKMYVEKIRPFFVLESSFRTNIDFNTIKNIFVFGDCEQELSYGYKTYRWHEFVMTNVSDYVCLFDFIKINNEIYKSSEIIPIKAG